VKCWEIIADNLHKAGWSLGWVSAIDSNGQTIWIVDVHRDEGKRFTVRADEKLAAFLELEAATRDYFFCTATKRFPSLGPRKSGFYCRIANDTATINKESSNENNTGHSQKR